MIKTPYYFPPKKKVATERVTLPAAPSGGATSNVTAGADGVMGAWVEFSASTPEDYVLDSAAVWNLSAGKIYQIEVGLGALGFEVVIGPAVVTGYTVQVHFLAFGPGLYIPAGSRVAVRAAGFNGGAGVGFGVQLGLSVIDSMVEI
jgi:hypothetical protein